MRGESKVERERERAHWRNRTYCFIEWLLCMCEAQCKASTGTEKLSKFQSADTAPRQESSSILGLEIHFNNIVLKNDCPDK